MFVTTFCLMHSLDLSLPASLYLPLFMMTLMKRDADDDDIQYTATTGKGKRKGEQKDSFLFLSVVSVSPSRRDE